MNATVGLPELFGSPISVCALPRLRAYRGKLLSEDHRKRGAEVHAASFIQRREIVLETELLARSEDLKLVVVHEIFHFVWPRLGNQMRAEYRNLLGSEIRGKARGELGESAEVQKQALRGHVSEMGSKQWREYACESFCDSAASFFSGLAGGEDVTLAARWREKRLAWFRDAFAAPRLC